MKYLANVSTLKYAQEECSGCGRCIEVCPHGVFVLQNKRAAITDKDLCMECGACAQNCQFGALTVLTGVGCASAVIYSMVNGGPASCDCNACGV